MATNVPGVTFGPLGFQAPSASQIQAGVQADLNTAFQTSFNFGTQGGSSSNPTPQGQLSASFTAIIQQSYNSFLFQATQTDPAFAQGRWHDAICRIYFMYRLPAQPTVLLISCQGLTGLTIPIGAQIQDPAQNVYTSTGSGAIGVGGTVGISFAANNPGPVQIPTTVSIFQAITGWDSASVVSGVLGQNTETDQQLELRRQNSVAQNSVGQLASIRGAVLSVPGVVDAYATENTSNGSATVGGVTLAPNSVYVAVAGGAYPAVAQAIWSKKAPGCSYNPAVPGAQTITVLDTVSGYAPPLPSYSVSFVDATKNALPVMFAVNLVNSAQVPSNAAQLIQNAIIAAFGGAFPGTPRASIGSTILASSFVAPVAALGSWASIRSLVVGSPNVPNAIFTGSITGSVLTVTSMQSGTIQAGATVSGSVGGTVVVIPGTNIVSQASGTAGQTGTYNLTVGISQNTPSQAGMTTVTPAAATVAVNINQEPGISAGNIAVTAT